MIVILKPGTKEEEILKLIKKIESLGVETQRISGSEMCVIGLVGDTSKIDPAKVEANKNVERIMPVQEPFKKANRLFHPENSIIDVLGNKIGDKKIALIAGPCSVESEEQITEIAKEVKALGASFLRGGAFKPRTSPYSFQGLELEGLELLKKAKAKTGLPIVTEIMSTSMIEKFIEDVDVIQVGARNMQNFDLLKALGEVDKPILLKRGLAATYEELLMAAEYIMSRGNTKVILCERGIRTFETATRNTLDVTAVPFLHEKTHLPIIIDPSHAAGISRYVKDLSLSATAVGADGLMIEVHENPAKAFSDGAQCVVPDDFDKIVKATKKIHDLRKEI